MGRFTYDTESGTGGFTNQATQRLAEIGECLVQRMEFSGGDDVQDTTTANYFGRNESTTQQRNTDERHGVRTVRVGIHDYCSQ